MQSAAASPNVRQTFEPHTTRPKQLLVRYSFLRQRPACPSARGRKSPRPRQKRRPCQREKSFSCRFFAGEHARNSSEVRGYPHIPPAAYQSGHFLSLPESDFKRKEASCLQNPPCFR